MAVNRNWLMALAIILASLFCREGIYHYIDILVIRHLWWVTSCPLNDAIVLFIAVILTLWTLCKPKSYRTAKGGGFWKYAIAVMLALFYLYVRYAHGEALVPFYAPLILFYSDIILLLITLWCFELPYYKKEEVAKLKKDLLGRDVEVNTIYAYLTNEDNDYDEALAVAITGSWGVGKTTFLHQLQAKFKENGISYFEYSPWHKSGDAVTVDFLQHLREYLAEEGFSFESLNHYITSLKVSSVTNWFSWTLHTIRHFWTGENSISHQIEHVQEEMKCLTKPVYAFIDDIDRVEEKDLRDVMALVRSTASFPNLVYIVAYDREVTAKMLMKDNGEKYLSKIFNASFALQSVEEEQMQNLATEMLYKQYPEMKQDDSPFVGIEITRYLPTLRDLYRYLNLFAKDYEAMHETREQTWFDYEMFVILELLKHTDLITWEMLRAKPALYLQVENDYWDSWAQYQLKEDPKIDNKDSLALLKYIFGDERKTESEFKTPGALQMMFMNKLSVDYIKKREFEEAINSNRLMDYAKNWASNKENLMFCLGHRLDLDIEQILGINILVLEKRVSQMSFFGEHLRVETGIHPLVTFSKIRQTASPYTYVKQHHELYLLVYEKVLNDNTGTTLAKLKMKAAEIEKPREMLAIVYGMMMIDSSMDRIPAKWMYELERILFERLVNEHDMENLDDQYYVAEALEYLPVFDFVNKKTKPLLEKDLATWLKLTLRVDRDVIEPTKIVVDAATMHTLFDTYNEYVELMKELKTYYAADKVALAMIEEHENLTRDTDLIGALPVSSFDIKKYPTLDGIHSDNQLDTIYMTSFYERTKEYMKKEKGGMFFENKSRQIGLFEE